jgi:hypothetical protein
MCHHARVRRRERGRLVCAALSALVLLTAAPASAAAQGTPIAAQVSSTTTGQPMPSGFVGFSFEYRAVHVYTGRDPTAVNPVLVQLIKAVTPDQSPVLRIGGNSSDRTWWPIPGMIPPGGVDYSLTNGWLRTTQALAHAVGAHLIMGLNLAGGRPAIAAAEARAIVQGIGAHYVQAFEIGNEPDLYGTFSWYRDPHGQYVFSRPLDYSPTDYIGEFSRWSAALPAVPLAGPAFSGLTWMGSLDDFLTAEPAVRIVTFHRYPLRACELDPANRLFASVPNLLGDSSSAGLAQQIAPDTAVAHAHGDLFRLDELNSAACSGKQGVSNTFASALWAIDTLFNLASVGVDGVNVHSLPGAAYAPFTFTKKGKTWSAMVHPVYYGLLMFAQAFPPGAQLLPVTAPPGPVKVWATQGTDGKTRVVLINKSAYLPAEVQLQLPGAQTLAGAEALHAPGITATTGVTLGGQSFGNRTTTGRLSGLPQLSQVAPVAGAYTVALPPASAILLTK